MSSDTRPIGSMSLDLDNKWSYLKIHGNPQWKEFPSYFDIAIPRILQILKEENLRITFFVVGQDAALDQHKDLLRAIADAGHEIGNHSFHHESWLHHYDEQKIRAELLLTHETLAKVTGYEPCGFRGPGFSLSESVLKVLKDIDYRYDASTWPTFIGPLARAYYMRTGNFSEEQKAERNVLFGTFQDGLRPLKGYQWAAPAEGLIEIPVSTFPVFRLPMHLSYLLYLREVSPALAHFYFTLASGAFRLTGGKPSFLLHTLDFLGKDDVKGLEFFPAMNTESTPKLELARQIIRKFRKQFRVVTMREHAEIIASNKCRQIRPSFAAAVSKLPESVEEVSFLQP